MESQPSTSTTTSTTAKQDPIPSLQNTTAGKRKSNTDPTLSIPNPAYSPVVQKYVTDAAEIIASLRITRNMFIVEVFKKCSEIALWEKRTGKISPGLLPTSTVPIREPLPLHTSDSYSSDVEYIPPGGDEVLNRFINKYSMPRISTVSSTVTASSATENISTKTSTADPTAVSTSQAENRNPIGRSEDPGYNKTPAGEMNNIRQGQPNHAYTLFASLSMAEDLTKIILTLSKEVKAELQTMEKIIATLPIAEMKKMIAETTKNMEDRMKGLEDIYSELKQIILDRSTQHFNRPNSVGVTLGLIALPNCLYQAQYQLRG